MNSFVRKNVMIWQKYEAIQNVHHSEKREGRIDKKMRKSDVGEGFATKKCDATHSKKRFCKWSSFWMTPMMMFYFAAFLWVYLLMILLAFCETNKPIYIKINICYIYKTRYLQKLNFRRPQSRKLFSGRFINAVHLAHAPIIAEQNDMQRALYPLSVLAAPSTDRQTLIFFLFF